MTWSIGAGVTDHGDGRATLRESVEALDGTLLPRGAALRKVSGGHDNVIGCDVVTVVVTSSPTKSLDRHKRYTLRAGPLPPRSEDLLGERAVRAAQDADRRDIEGERYRELRDVDVSAEYQALLEEETTHPDAQARRVLGEERVALLAAIQRGHRKEVSQQHVREAALEARRVRQMWIGR